MVITEEIRQLAEVAPFVPITTVSEDGEPHLIVVGEVKKIKEDGVLVFGVYKMEVTRKNLEANDEMQVVLASTVGEPAGYRLSGKAWSEGDEVLFKAETAESLL